MNLNTRREKLIYLAAMLDGEGSIGIERLSPCKVKKNGKEAWQRKKYYYICRLNIINTFYPLMEWLQKEFKGTIQKRKCVTGRKQVYVWRIMGDDLRCLIEEVHPFLFEKKPQAEALLEYRKTVGKTGWLVTDDILEKREQLWLLCKKLNQNGPA